MFCTVFPRHLRCGIYSGGVEREHISFRLLGIGTMPLPVRVSVCPFAVLLVSSWRFSVLSSSCLSVSWSFPFFYLQGGVLRKCESIQYPRPLCTTARRSDLVSDRRVNEFKKIMP